ncbi:peptidase, putative [Bodo saltans]|uniref:Peptidase, putative n=1 Tax=Bodo saltans TaxID=75058 RepID=A0A0S4KJR0_BODSA|nr:peptidase, putative [Bodo saltans]|eukprot:CUI15412.1 peptidase, putative [Bodo saltans]
MEEESSDYVEENVALHRTNGARKVRIYPRDIVVAAVSTVVCCLIFGIVLVILRHNDSTTCPISPRDLEPTSTICADPPSLLRNQSYLASTRTFLRSRINASSIDARVYHYSFEPHIAGGPRNNILADETFSFFTSLGFDDVRREVMPALLMNLTHRSLNRTNSTTGTVIEELNLSERNILNQSAWDTALPPTNGYTGKGRVSGPLVWVNYGSVEDFANISHVNLTGTIVLVRYGSIFRGDKVKYAQQRGAVGVVICLDPHDMVQGAEFPSGPWANNDTVQRGSITNNEGDPLTPTWPSEIGGPTIDVQDTFDPTIMGKGMTLPTIPVQPISFGNARRLLQGLATTPLPPGWDNTGFLDLFSNGIGPGPATAALEVQRDLVVYNITNVIATMVGDTEPDRTVIIGAHRDAWTYGAADPVSGHSVVLEVAQALGDLRSMKQWTPRRTIQVCSWDAEEWAIIGSNEYVETNIELLRQRGVAYLNLDVAVSGREVMYPNGSPLLQHAVEAMGAEVFLPNGQPISSITAPYAACGSGSDHVGFIQLAGVPVLDCDIENVSSSYEAMYHSNYDSYYWMATFGDPQFLYHKAMAELYGSMLLYLSDSSVLPMRVEDYSTKLETWVAEYSDKPENSFADFSFMNESLRMFSNAAAAHKSRSVGWRTLTWTLQSVGGKVMYPNGSPLLQHAVEAMGAEVFLPNGQPISSITAPYAACGSGSDHVGFIQLAGVPVLDCDIENVSSSYEAVYHSNYDSYYWMATFGDPQFLFHKAMAELYGSMLLYLSDSSVLPMRVEDYSTKLETWVAEYSDKPENSFADFSFMNESLRMFSSAAAAHKSRREALQALCDAAPQNVSVQLLRQLNDATSGLERVFLGKGELESGQPWYLHVVFTPSASDSYAATTMPLIAQGLATGNATQANFAIGRIAQFVRRGSTYLNSSLVVSPWYQNIEPLSP